MDGPSALSGFEGRDVRSLIDARAALRGAHPFLIWQPFDAPERTWSYAEFRHAVRRFAAGLHARGMRPGQRLLIHSDNCPEFMIAWLGCACAGVVSVTTNARSTQDELAYYARHSGAVAAVTQPGFAGLLSAAAPQLAWIAVSETDGGTAAGDAAAEPFAAVDGDRVRSGAVQAAARGPRRREPAARDPGQDRQGRAAQAPGTGVRGTGGRGIGVRAMLTTKTDNAAHVLVRRQG